MFKKIESYLTLKKRVLIQNILKKNYRPFFEISESEEITKELEKYGFFKTEIDFLKKNNVPIDWFDHINEIKYLLDKRESESYSQIKNRSKGSYAIDLPSVPKEIEKKLNNFAKSKFLLDIIKNYFCLDVFYRGVQIRKDLNDGKNIETRLWHCDGEDSRIIKIIFYLDDVFENDGPFTYIPKTIINKKTKINFDKNGRLDDVEMKKYVDKASIKKFFGKVGNCIFVDTCNIYHKGELPLNKSRYAIFFCYNSSYPLNPEFCKPLN